MTKKTGFGFNNFAVVWFSPRGFANEGSYYYGTETEMEQLHDSYNQYQSKYIYVSGHRTLSAAQAKAEALARRDNKSTRRHEICCISAAPIADYMWA